MLLSITVKFLKTFSFYTKVSIGTFIDFQLCLQPTYGLMRPGIVVKNSDNFSCDE